MWAREVEKYETKTVCKGKALLDWVLVEDEEQHVFS